jgi:hypothetical protein
MVADFAAFSAIFCFKPHFLCEALFLEFSAIFFLLFFPIFGLSFLCKALDRLGYAK